MKLQRIRYRDLNSHQRENYTLAKLAAVLADYGYTCLRLSDDWHGADLITHHIDGHDLLVQLKGRFALKSDYRGKNLWIAFPHDRGWYLFPHNEVHDQASTRNPRAKGWRWPSPPKWALELLEPYWIDSSSPGRKRQ